MIKNGMRVIHPGEVLKEEYLEPLGMSVNALSKALNVSASRLNDIVLERRGITADTAMRLARHLDTTPQFWMSLQVEYELLIAESKSANRIKNEVSRRIA